MYCFFGSDIRKWRKTRDGKEYVLNLSRANYRQKLCANVFSKRTVGEIKKKIINVDIQGEFKRMIHGYIEGELPALQGFMRGS
jgi:hypothetical protein